LPARQLFLEALSHPWSPAADFASEALVALEDRGSVPALVELVEAPDPLAPFVHGTSHDTRPRVRELVRINPVRNCLLCHAASTRTADMVRAVVPDPQQPLPPSFTPAYYDSHAQNRLFVRADVTYLRQDFAVPQLVARPGPWPAFQRYDYLVRTRPLFVGERPWPTNQPSPQRQAALVALRELTGPDAPNPAAIRPAGLAPVPVASHTQGMIDLRDGETR
jgi:hypothetical protein